ncbi:ATP-dependent RNA helicase dbp7, partial [Spiromyces aspiralis]
ARLYRLHGSLPQKRRTEVYHSFAKSTASSPAILFTTDVAARGLDLPNVSHIIQFDPPTEVTDYVHRVGRTARLGKVGAAYLFLLPSETEYVEMLKSKGVGPSRVTSMESILRKAAAAAAAESLAPAVGNKHKDHKRRRDEGMTDQVWQDVAAELQTTIERYVLTKKATATLAKKAYLSSIRAYSTHITSERHIFHVKKLHLGHMVKSFGLREAPSQLATTNRKFHQQQKRHTDKAALEKSKANKKRKQQRGHSYTNAEEFAVAGDVKSLLKAPKSKKARRE